MEDTVGQPANKQENKQFLVQCSRNYKKLQNHNLKMKNEKRAMLK